jgi:four helix bundle protein
MAAQDLRRRLKDFALRIIRLCAELPQNNVGWVLGKQILKSGTSIGANYCEAQRASSRAHFVSILEIALRESDETKYWLELLAESGVIDPERLIPITKECDEIIRILASSVKSSKQPPQPD